MVGGLRSDERLAALETERLRTAESCERDRNATAGLSRRVAALERAERRRMQGAEPEPEPEPELGGENVKILRPQVVRCGGPGDTTANGNFDYSQCADRAFASCHAEACAGHSGRRLRCIGILPGDPANSYQRTGGRGPVSLDTIKPRATPSHADPTCAPA
jgi:hypothetical protein